MIALPRILAMLSLVPPSPQAITVAELVAALATRGFRVATRSVQRDLVTLSREMPLEARTASKPFGWCWAEGAKCPCCGGAR